MNDIETRCLRFGLSIQKHYCFIQASLSWCKKTISSLSGIVVNNTKYCAIGPGSNPEEGMDVCKCIVPLRPGGILNSRRASSPLERTTWRTRIEECDCCGVNFERSRSGFLSRVPEKS
ncbi:hypothetical protein TNCV_1089091 [Trichonephila clavipes]|uniref:Uncharacterized protein n=1 Tax=Trichonephila clavipes TaxID=2585209 RepID=A0A8X6T2D8_TRICX|nr:hypothetical protein TNCV_1089091 [Trichonephila clavipes]